MGNARLVALGVAPLVAVVCGYAALFLGAAIGGADLVIVLAFLVGIPVAAARRVAAPGDTRWGLAVGGVAIALVEAFVLLLFLLSRANFG